VSSLWKCGKFLFLRPAATAACAALLALFPLTSPGEEPSAHYGDEVPAEIDEIYLKGLGYLVKSQSDAGCWMEHDGNQAGITGLALLAMLAHGDDPNFGPYSVPIKKALNFILTTQRGDNGYIGVSMYNHGFATLALAEAYGSVNDPRIGPALKKAVDLILSSQTRNLRKAWRYSPESTDADTTVSGAQMVALFAARNAGIPVPDKAIAAGLAFYRECQTDDGGFGYENSSGGSTPPRSAIGALVLALAKQKDTTDFKAVMKYLQHSAPEEHTYKNYFIYYAAQAFFHAEQDAWRKWNDNNVLTLGQSQNDDGSWQGQPGPAFSTSTALLSLALNYRFLPIYER
jgi:squalene cyclase